MRGGRYLLGMGTPIEDKLSALQAPGRVMTLLALADGCTDGREVYSMTGLEDDVIVAALHSLRVTGLIAAKRVDDHTSYSVTNSGRNAIALIIDEKTTPPVLSTPVIHTESQQRSFEPRPTRRSRVREVGSWTRR